MDGVRFNTLALWHVHVDDLRKRLSDRNVWMKGEVPN